MKREGGVSIIPCKVNGLNLSFIFDTGASDVTISLTEASFMLKNGYLNKEDIFGTTKYSDANGNISEGIIINLKEIEISGLKLYNVRAAIVNNLDAPLLLGQSALSKLGKIQLDLGTNTLTIIETGKIKTTPKNDVLTKSKFISTGSIYCADYDGNHYKTIIIGEQEWMAENLSVRHFNNGDEIPEAETVEEWDIAGEQGKPAWCYYYNDPANGKIYGKLYNWFAVNDSRGLAPNGWHIPSYSEWTILTVYLGGETVAGKKMKATIGWEDNGNGTNESGFLGLPGGIRGLWNTFNSIGSFGGWWSSTEDNSIDAWTSITSLSSHGGPVDRGSTLRRYGLSVRCLRD
jgi:clan AA aspartic protease (TIGR02281 family)